MFHISTKRWAVKARLHANEDANRYLAGYVSMYKARCRHHANWLHSSLFRRRTASTARTRREATTTGWPAMW